MKILKEYYLDREGNDCRIYTSVALLQIQDGFYVVVSSEQYFGSWTNNEADASSWGFNNFDEAMAKYKKLVKGNSCG